MNTLSNINELFEAFNVIPDGTNEKFCLNGLEITLYKKDGVIDVRVRTNEEEKLKSFDDSKVKEKVNRYKEGIEEIDDNIFLDILEEMREVINITEFDDLLELESYTEENASRVEELIDHSTLIIRKYLQNKIQDLMELYESF